MNDLPMFMKKYEQDAICETWEVLADIVYPQGYLKLKKRLSAHEPENAAGGNSRSIRL